MIVVRRVVNSGRERYGGYESAARAQHPVHFCNQFLRIFRVFEDFGTQNMVKSGVGKWNISSVKIYNFRMSSHPEVIRLGNVKAGIKAIGRKQSPERHFAAPHIKHRTLHNRKMGHQKTQASQKL